jgi:hypothetical protein
MGGQRREVYKFPTVAIQLSLLYTLTYSSINSPKVIAAASDDFSSPTLSHKSSSKNWASHVK